MRSQGLGRQGAAFTHPQGTCTTRGLGHQWAAFTIRAVQAPSKGQHREEEKSPSSSVPPTSRWLQLGTGGSRSCRARARNSDKSALEAGLQFLVGGGRGHARHGLEIGKRSRAKGKATCTHEVQ